MLLPKALSLLVGEAGNERCYLDKSTRFLLRAVSASLKPTFQTPLNRNRNPSSGEKVCFKLFFCGMHFDYLFESLYLVLIFVFGLNLSISS